MPKEPFVDTNAFETLAQKTLERLFDALEDAIGADADVDFEGGILTIELEDGRQYVINKHTASQEIWLSSPISGAVHFAHDADTGQWASTRGSEVLMCVLSTELETLTGHAVKLD
jgi:frataxin